MAQYLLTPTLMNKVTKSTLLALVASVTLIVGHSRAAQITGDIDFAGQAFFDTNSLATATQVVNFRSTGGVKRSASVTQADGDFAGITPGTLASFPNVYTFVPSTPVSPLWTVGGFTFDLTASTVVLQNSFFLLIKGVGILSGNGFEETPGTWAFTSQQSDGASHASFSFSANTAAQPGGQVPDGGTTVMLLGVALMGIVIIRKKFTAPLA